jgi:addiction module HigA family antidote
MAAKLRPVHPGEILREEFMKPLGLNPHKLSLALRVSAPAVYEIVAEERAISTEMALRLAHYFGTTPEFWMNLQTRYDLEVARDREAARIAREVRPMARTTKRVVTRG